MKRQLMLHVPVDGLGLTRRPPYEPVVVLRPHGMPEISDLLRVFQYELLGSGRYQWRKLNNGLVAMHATLWEPVDVRFCFVLSLSRWGTLLDRIAETPVLYLAFGPSTGGEQPLLRLLHNNRALAALLCEMRGAPEEEIAA